ncbi:MAG: helix-turn-helix domain-containing protein [Lachnospiraceae bacterium]|nr:helix-turn-helix domain-containing protein [Lachnospiraceae bacterium]
MPSTTQTRLGCEIRAYRIRHNMNQGQFGNLCGVTRATVHRWESEAVRPSVGAMVRLSEILGEPLAVLFDKAGKSAV